VAMEIAAEIAVRVGEIGLGHTDERSGVKIKCVARGVGSSVRYCE